MSKKRFALIGAAGYIAPRHMQAIKETGNDLVAALDPSDSVGIIDSYFPESSFFTEFERFDRHLEKLRRKGEGVDYVAICSPNYLHDAHIRFGLRLGANVICEKPMVLNPWNVDALASLEQEYPGKIYNILQLRLHPSVIALKQKVEEGPKDKVYNVELRYFTSRGRWYHVSWKGDVKKSGGITSNIGIHFFDMLIWIFGDVRKSELEINSENRAKGRLVLNRATVDWELGVDYNLLPDDIKKSGVRTYRSLKIEDKEFEFSGGFTELHTKSYKDILIGRGFGVDEVRPVIDLISEMRVS